MRAFTRYTQPRVRLLHNLSLFTVSFLISIYTLASQTHFLNKGKGPANCPKATRKRAKRKGVEQRKTK